MLAWKRGLLALVLLLMLWGIVVGLGLCAAEIIGEIL